ncbi:hypothetical protein D3C72_1215870 [compost metagenome]
MQDRAVARLINAADDFHQRRFSRTILAADGMHFTAAQIKMHVGQRFDARKFLADIVETQKGRTLRARHLLRRKIAPNCRCALRHLETSHPYPRSTGVHEQVKWLGRFFRMVKPIRSKFAILHPKRKQSIEIISVISMYFHVIK